jgi:catechol-2,3-dioxygenase
MAGFCCHSFKLDMAVFSLPSWVGMVAPGQRWKGAMAGVTGLNHITLAVGDVERSFEFCTRLLGFEPVALWDKGAYFQAGDV